MKNLIYYPGFESTDDEWLKFALLYIDKLHPIVPVLGEAELSRKYRMLIEETDLIDLHRPTFHEGYTSSLDAIDIATRIAENPYRFDMFFNKVNVERDWRDKKSQTYKIFEDKFSLDFKRYCIDNQYCQQADGGILVSESLGVLYMVVLSNAIADLRGISPITDNENIDKLSYFLKAKAPVHTAELHNAKSVLQLQIPSNLNEISFDKILHLRNSHNFIKYRQAFHTALEDFYLNIEAGTESENFIKKYQSSWNDFWECIASVSSDVIYFGLGTGMLLSAKAYTETEFFRTIVSSGVGLVIKSNFSLNRAWKNTETTRHCRRYLKGLGSLS